MPYRPMLARIQKLFRAGADFHFQNIEDGFKSGPPKQPAQPMTDFELARAIREFQANRSPTGHSGSPRRFEGKVTDIWKINLKSV
jgi:hypothetical protein